MNDWSASPKSYTEVTEAPGRSSIAHLPRLRYSAAQRWHENFWGGGGAMRTINKPLQLLMAWIRLRRSEGKSLGSGPKSGHARAASLVVLLAAVVVVMAYSGGSEASAQDRNQGRSMVISRHGIVA